MFERIGRGWSITKSSWDVVKRHPRLLLFPVFSGVAVLAVIAAISLSVFAGARTGYGQNVADNVRGDDPVVYVILFVFYFACTFVVIFFNASMIFCALQCFEGKEPSLRAGLAAAVGRLPQILGWTLVAATVGVILQVLQSLLRDKLGFIGSLLGGLLEFAWGVATYFVVPVLVVEKVGPIEAVKRSSAILRRTWGETVGGEGGLGIISFLLLLPVVALSAALGFGFEVNAAIAVALAAIAVAYVLALAVVFSALGTIFRTGVYVYATTGQAPGTMDPALLQGAFRAK